MNTLLLSLLLLQIPGIPIEAPPPYAGQYSGVAKIKKHWWDFHKNRDGVVAIKLKADLRAPIYYIRDLTDPQANFLVVDPSYAHADHFSIKGKKGHRFSWSVAGRP